eukprot:9820950-Ditylum_brightwellii.AAC.1
MPSSTKSQEHNIPLPTMVDSWTIGPSMEHYRCIKCFVPSTRATVDTDTLKLLGHDIPTPQVDDKDTFHQALADVVHLLQNPQKTNLPEFYKGDEVKNAFTNSAELLKRDNRTVLPELKQTVDKTTTSTSQTTPKQQHNIH